MKFEFPRAVYGLKVVAPFMGAWIEMAGCAGGCHYAWVAPFMGAWIEMIRSSMKTGTGKRSHPSRVRGLKWFSHPAIA